MVEDCPSLLEWSLNCEISNLSTMILELIIAFIFAGVLSFYFYKRQKKDAKKIANIGEEQTRLTQEYKEQKKNRDRLTIT